MTPVFDRIVIAVADLDAAAAQYAALFGIDGYAYTAPGGQRAVGWTLANTALELLEGTVPSPVIEGFVLAVADAEAPAMEAIPNTLGISIARTNGAVTAQVSAQQKVANVPGLAVDHVVLRTGDADACIELFEKQLGIRLALGKTVPEWGGRMLFFRSGKMTLEVIQGEEDVGKPSAFWGIAYKHPDLNALLDELDSRDVQHSAPREGRKPGTQVVTLKSHCLDIPSLLIQPVKA